MQQFYINTLTEYSERFTLAKFMEFLNNDNYDPLNSNVLNELNNVSIGGFVTYTGANFRPDLLSEQVYEGDSQYWWVLLVYNQMSSVDDLLSGQKLKYPALDALEDLYFTLKIKQGLG